MKKLKIKVVSVKSCFVLFAGLATDKGGAAYLGRLPIPITIDSGAS